MDWLGFTVEVLYGLLLLLWSTASPGNLLVTHQLCVCGVLHAHCCVSSLAVCVCKFMVPGLCLGCEMISSAELIHIYSISLFF
jgi:hypothetical protein